MKVIAKLKKKGLSIFVYSVAKEAGVSRNFLYKNERLLKANNEERNSESSKPQSETLETINQALKLKIMSLEKEISDLKKMNQYKEKYETILI